MCCVTRSGASIEPGWEMERWSAEVMISVSLWEEHKERKRKRDLAWSWNMKEQKGSQCVLHGLRMSQRKNEKYRSEDRGMGLRDMVYCGNLGCSWGWQQREKVNLLKSCDVGDSYWCVRDLCFCFSAIPTSLCWLAQGIHIAFGEWRHY